MDKKVLELHEQEMEEWYTPFMFYYASEHIVNDPLKVALSEDFIELFPFKCMIATDFIEIKMILFTKN